MNTPLSRRQVLSSGLTLAAAAAMSEQGGSAPRPKDPLFRISLAEWSHHKALFAGKMDHLEFAHIAKHEYGIEAVEYVNQFFKDKAEDKGYLRQLKTRAADEGVKILLIMCDGEGNLGDSAVEKRMKAVENHYKWVDAAKTLGCHSIRVNAASDGTYAEQVERAADGLHRLTEYATKQKLNVIVENHGGLSSNGAWLAEVMRKVNHPRCGTLPDFGNFHLGDGKEYDRYKGVGEMMPYAKAVSAKSNDFDAAGNEIHTDYSKMVRIVLAAGYHGYMGIEYEGSILSEADGIKATKTLLERVRSQVEQAKA